MAYCITHDIFIRLFIDWLIVLTINWEIINPVCFIKAFKLMTSVLSLFLVYLDQQVFLCSSFCFSSCLHLVALVVYNFTISCLKLKYVLSWCETSKLYQLHKMILTFKIMFLSSINKKTKKIVEQMFILSLIPLLQLVLYCFLTVWLHCLL